MIKPFDIEKAAAEYQAAKPFPHVVLQNLVCDEVIEQVHEEFPEIHKVKSVVYNNPLEIKNITSGPEGIKTTTQKLIDYLNSQEWLNILQRLTGIREPLIADPKLMGGGLHESPRGGLLKIHADFNKHYETGYDRRVNLLLYLNKDWLPEYGGAIELWPEDMSKCEVSVLPTFNTMVIFNTTDFSYHGHPDPNMCPDGEKRKSLALYYYSNGRPAYELNPKAHNSLWQTRKGHEADKDVERLKG